MEKGLLIAESIVNYVRTRIVVGQLLPGQKLNELQLAYEINVSRPPLREAFRILQNEDLALYISRRGTFVTPLSLEHCQYTYQVRMMMEFFAIDVLESKKIKDLPLVDSHLAAAQDQDIVELNESSSIDEKIVFFKSIADFHVSFVNSAGNKRLDTLYSQVLPTIYRYQFTQLFKIPKMGHISIQ
jgi:DNA-binding GntR family transcriptional regulator